jgi:hypothetical protein
MVNQAKLKSSNTAPKYMVMKFLGLMNKLNNSIRRTVIPYGETQQC